jgi:osmoprotectant transport system substrate-binding protein
MRTSRRRLLVALLLPLLLVLAACGDDNGDDEGGSGSGSGSGSTVEGSTIRLVPQDFPESQTLTQAFGQFLEARGYDVEIQDASGFRDIVYPALEDGKADLIIDYTGSAATFLDDTGTPSPDPDETYSRLEDAIGDKPYQALDYSPAEDKNALVVLTSFAEENDVETISDLKPLEGEIVFGGSPECLEREDCLLGYQSDEFYGLSFKDVQSVAYGPPLVAGLKSGDLHAVQYQTTAAEIESGEVVALEDDKGMLSADNIVPVLRTEVADEYGDDLISAINELSAMLTTEDLIGWNARTDIDKDDPADVAREWLESKDLLS